jgi:hypothetical protein
MQMKRIVLVLVLLSLVLSGCLATSSNDIERAQSETAQMSIIQNQPAPDLGGYSFEREIVIQTYLARNNTIATYAYMFTMDGKLIEICPSIGYPIPYSTQITSPDKGEVFYGESLVLQNAEPNGLYPPGDAAATLVQCTNEDGSVTPVYIEWYVLAFPYRIKSDFQLEKIGATSFSVKVDK